MKQLSKTIFSIFAVLLFAASISIVYSTSFLPTVAACFSVSLVLSFVPTPSGSLKGIVLEQWAKYIIGRFWKDNMFLKMAYNDTQYVKDGRIVHIPQVGAKPTVVKNRSTFPAVAVRRTDTDVVYALDEYTTDPTHIPNIDAIHLSYSKQDSVLGEHMSVIDETVADDMLLKWAAGATFMRTTGAAVGPVTGQTGNRKGFDQTDLQKVMTKMNTQNVPKTDRNILFDDNMFDFFYNTLGVTNAKDFSRYENAADGTIGRLHGFNIFTRSSVFAATSADAPKALGASLAATDNLVSLAWQKNAVAAAVGDTKLFQDLANPLYYGDIYSTLVMAGGRVRRADGLGIIAITQDASA